MLDFEFSDISHRSQPSQPTQDNIVTHRHLEVSILARHHRRVDSSILFLTGRCALRGVVLGQLVGHFGPAQTRFCPRSWVDKHLTERRRSNIACSGLFVLAGGHVSTLQLSEDSFKHQIWHGLACRVSLDSRRDARPCKQSLNVGHMPLQLTATLMHSDMTTRPIQGSTGKKITHVRFSFGMVGSVLQMPGYRLIFL